MLAAGKLLAPQASRTAKWLANKALYRRRVDRSVRRRTKLVYPRHLFRAWLKSVSAMDLEEPVETAAERLAQQLDGVLEADAGWRKSESRQSDARTIVEATYLAILQSSNPMNAVTLQEHWSRRRSDQINTSMAELAGGHTPVEQTDAVEWLHRRSAQRRTDRQSAFSVDPAALESALASLSLTIPNVGRGSCVLVHGAFGSGKSEVAEEWHRRQIATFAADVNCPIPVWVHARDAAIQGFENALADAVGARRLAPSGVAVVLDGLDEVDGATAEAIMRDARVFVAASVRSIVLATCRSGVVPTKPDDLGIEGLSEEVARSLVEGISGRDHITWSWSPELIETIRRPFFALAAGSALASGATSAGQVEMMTSLVERALSRATTAVAISPQTVQSTLAKLGVALTRSGGLHDGLSLTERHTALATRLVVGEAQVRVGFSLPIFEQWFAAQQLLSDEQLAVEPFTTPQSFDRWRWALAIAVLRGTTDQQDQLIEATLRMNAGAAAWIVDQVARCFPAHRDEGCSLDAETAGQRLVRALRGWIDALGDLAPLVLPVRTASEHFQIGVEVDGPRLSLAWARGTFDADRSVDLPQGIHPLLPPPPGWLADSAGIMPAGTHWPWTFVRDKIAGATLRLLEHGRLGTEGGIWQAELRYRAARAISGRRGVFHHPMTSVDVLASASQLLAQVEQPGYAMFQLHGVSVHGSELLDLVDWLASDAPAVIERLVPAPDVTQPSGSSVWDFYSPRQIVRFCAETYGLAAAAYEQLVDSEFASLDWSLGLNACRPFGVIGVVSYQVSTGYPVLRYEELPMEILNRGIGNDSRLEVSSNGRAAEITDWISARRTSSPFWHLGGASTVIECNSERPVSHVVAQWIWGDLQRLHLGTGTFPQV